MNNCPRKLYQCKGEFSRVLKVPPFLIQSWSEDSSFFGPAWDGASPVPGSEFCGRHMAQRRVRPALIVIPPPSLDLNPSVFQA